MTTRSASTLALSLLLFVSSAGADAKSSGPALVNVKRLTTVGDGGEPYFSFDGRSIVFQAKRDGRPFDQIYTMTSDGADQKLISSGTGRATCSYFMPDGKSLLYASTHARTDEPPTPPQGYGTGGKYDWSFDSAFDIFVADLSGKILKRLVQSPGYDAEATVSPKGDRIVFTSDRDGDLEIYSMALDGSDLKRLTNEKGYDGGAFYSPDGRRIIYRASRTDDYRALQIWLMNADGSGKRQLTSGKGTSFAPSWHPDGRRIVYCSNSFAPPDNRGNFELYLMDVDGPADSAPVALTDFPGFDGFPVFSPDGRHLVFSSNRDGDTPYQTSIFKADFKE